MHRVPVDAVPDRSAADFPRRIDAALNPDTWQPAAGERLDLDRLLAIALAERPGELPLFMSFDENRPVVNVTTGARPDVPASCHAFRVLRLDQRPARAAGHAR